VTPAPFSAGAGAHPPSVAIHTITIATTACGHSDRRAARERHRPDGHLPPPRTGMVMPTQRNPRPEMCTRRSARHPQALARKAKQSGGDRMRHPSVHAK
jgi:hypothetical protein